MSYRNHRDYNSAIPFNSLSDDALVRRRYLLEHVLPFSLSTMKRHLAKGAFPPPVIVEPGRILCWRVGDVRDWQAAQRGFHRTPFVQVSE